MLQNLNEILEFALGPVEPYSSALLLSLVEFSEMIKMDIVETEYFLTSKSPSLFTATDCERKQYCRSGNEP